MPCSNVTELLRVTLDSDERVEHYRLIKDTCGAGVGDQSLLLDFVCGKTAAELLDLDADAYCAQNAITDEVELFLRLKHLFALQSALGAYAGKAAARAGDACAICEIMYDQGHVIIDAEISIDIVTDKIKACGRCAGCGIEPKLPDF